jgi:type IV pilus assembly protein PilE
MPLAAERKTYDAGADRPDQGTRVNQSPSTRGFTLIELMIVVAVVAILAALAIPSYNDQIRRSRRADAMSALESLALRQEQWRANNATYGTLAEIGGVASTEFYNYTVVENTAANFRLRATAIVGSGQDRDSGCTQLEVDRNRVKTPANCWGR